MTMPDRPDITSGSGDFYRSNPHEGPKPDPAQKSDIEWVKSPTSSPQANTATIFAANTKTILGSSFGNLSEPTTVQLRSLDDKTPKDAPLSRFYKRLLVGLIVFGGLCVVAIVGFAIAFPEQTSAQKDAVALLTHLATLIFGMVVGLFTAKQL
jgi:hypothetical protein